MRASLILVFYFSFLVLVPHESQAQTDSSVCLKLLIPLKKNIEDVQSQGGVWGIYSKISSLNRHSSEAIKLDSRISKLFETLTYLCDTSKGVPLNELASYVSRKVMELGEERFKNLHVTLGKPEQEIETWLAYTKIALGNRDRLLEHEKIKQSIQVAGGLITRYRDLYSQSKNSGKIEPVLSRTLSLSQDIDDFLTGDPYVALAIFEESQVPFWDIDENYGGS